MKPLSVSLIITTYNAPDYLSLCIKSVLTQTQLPNEILIADDGSGEATRLLIENYSKSSPITIKHVWQPDSGFRVSAIRNKAILAAKHEYIIQIDGDVILNPHFIADHIKYAKPNTYIGASRCYIKEVYSKLILKEQYINFREIKEYCRIKFNSKRIPLLTPLFLKSKSHNLVRIQGCNMAYWRKDAIRINGYNEDIQGWGSEDSEFAIRLSNSGLKKNYLKFSAIAYHIWHEKASRASHKKNNEIMYDALNTKSTYVPNGIKK